MNVTFLHADPLSAAHGSLGSMLQHGVDQVAIACAFLSAGGERFLEDHLELLAGKDSFLVVSDSDPTDLEALARLHEKIPGRIWLHLGLESPDEKQVGKGLMHSKVFLARSGRTCRLWVGSHNLTASALNGGANCEAAILLEGDKDEQPFVDALAHLEACRKQSVPFGAHQPQPPPPPAPPGTETLIIHAETGGLMVDKGDHIHLRLETIQYDTILNPGGAIWVYLYKEGELSQAKPRPRPQAAFSGVLTALNHTQKHPRNPGIPAAWQDAAFIIEPVNHVYKLLKPSEMSQRVVTQSVIHIQKEENPDSIWFRSPKQIITVKEPVPSSFHPLNPQFRGCFSTSSSQGNQLVRKPRARRRLIYRVISEDAGRLDPGAIQTKLQVPPEYEVEVPCEGQTSFVREHIYLADRMV